MPLPLPNLDARSFNDLVEEMRGLIPHFAPDWTNHNPSDPGITFIELLAWWTEATLYRVNRIPEDTYRQFCSFLLGHASDPGLPLDAAKQQALRAFGEPFRAVTAEDFEREARRAHTDVARVRVVPNEADGMVTVVVIPSAGATASPHAIQRDVQRELDRRKVVGTRIRVRGAIFTPVTLVISVAFQANTKAPEVRGDAVGRVRSYLDPLAGGPEGTGWPFGRPVSIYELFHLMESIPGVEHVQALVLNGDSALSRVAVQDLPRLEGLTVNGEEVTL